MSEYYFFHDEKKSRKIIKWFLGSFHGTVILEHSAPVTFRIDDVTYTIKFIEDTQTIYCIKLCGGEIKPYHQSVIEKIDKFLNKLKNE